VGRYLYQTYIWKGQEPSHTNGSDPYLFTSCINISKCRFGSCIS